MKPKPGSHIHLMGICGTAMASLAGLLKDLGYKITGSDQNVYPPMSTQLEKLGIKIKEGYKKENLDPRPDLVIVGNVITRNHEEAQALLASDIPYTSLPKALGEFLIADRQSIVIAGTHGKTTITSMMAWIADQCGKEPGFLIGGVPLNFSFSFRAPKGNWFVIEGDEYDTAFFDKVPKFVHYRPRYVILSSIEFDHADIYKDLDHVKSAFRSLLKLIPKDGLLIAHAEDKNIKEILAEAPCRVVTYGLSTGDYQVVDRENRVGRNQFSVSHNGEQVADLAIKLFGPHNSLNALAAFALARELKWEQHKVLQAMATYQGVKRRQEVISTKEGITIVEDFAHHPTAVKVTIDGIKEQYPGQKIFAVFEPRSATSRRKVFQKDYELAFGNATEVVIAPAYDQSRIGNEDRFSPEDLVVGLKKRRVDAHYFPSIDDIVQYLKANAKAKDVILLMSNGSFGGIYQKLTGA